MNLLFTDFLDLDKIAYYFDPDNTHLFYSDYLTWISSKQSEFLGEEIFRLGSIESELDEFEDYLSSFLNIYISSPIRKAYGYHYSTCEENMPINELERYRYLNDRLTKACKLIKEFFESNSYIEECNDFTNDFAIEDIAEYTQEIMDRFACLHNFRMNIMMFAIICGHIAKNLNINDYIDRMPINDIDIINELFLNINHSESSIEPVYGIINYLHNIHKHIHSFNKLFITNYN